MSEHPSKENEEYESAQDQKKYVCGPAIKSQQSLLRPLKSDLLYFLGSHIPFGRLYLMGGPPTMAPHTESEPLLSPPVLAPQTVKTFDAGTVDSNEYGAISGFSRTKLADRAELIADTLSVPAERQKRVIIVGAGVSGIQQATILLKQGILKHEDIQIFDALDGYGGVWQKNTYPGCACDVPAMIYTTSYYICKYWTNFYATQPQIKSYYTQFAQDYQLDKCTSFGSFVKSCFWDDQLLQWHVQVEDKTGRTEHWMADVVCQCVGSLDRPKFGNTPGREKFRGESWHTAHWRHDFDLTGLKVGILGCGPSVAQIIPEIIDKVGHMTVYMRTPPVCVARSDFQYSRFFRWAVKWIPGFAYLVRQRMNLRMMMLGKKTATNNTPQNDFMTRTAIEFMESQVEDPKLREIVRPVSKYYCKRPLRLDNFYTSLAKSNCTVTRDRLIRITEEGVVSADNITGEEKETKFDVIIYGTGFNVAKFLDHVSITGIGGIDLQEKWSQHPEALYGLATSQFPNMFFCFGPNSATVWSSQQDIWERQARFAAKAIRYIIRHEGRGIKMAMYPERRREEEHNNEIQKLQLQSLVWAQSDCLTYYKNDDGWNTYTMPFSYPRFWWMTRKINWAEWVTLTKSVNGIVPWEAQRATNGQI